MRTLLPLLLALGLAASETPSVLVLLADGFNREEHFGSVAALWAAGYRVEVAGIQRGTVFLKRDGSPDEQGRDVEANLALDEVTQLQRYAALLIPGGYSPGALEQVPAALRICREALAAGLPVAAICHGGRLLLAAGELEQRVWTGLYTIADERPDLWTASGRGRFVDQAVVRDGTLISARYPGDVTAFAHALLQELAARGHRPLPRRRARVALLLPGVDPQLRFLLRSGLSGLGHDCLEITREEWLAKGIDPLPDCLLRVPAAAAWSLPESLRALPLLEPELDAASLPQRLPEIAQAVAAHGREPAGAEPAPIDSVIALRPGFDDLVAVALLAQLRTQGLEPLIVAAERGWQRGCNGLPLEATARYTDPLDLAPDALVIAPGGTWPELRPDARQGVGADWLPAQAQADRQRRDWLLAQWRAGARLVAIGHDALALGRGEPAFDGCRFATSPMMRWSFGRDPGARFSEEPALQSAERLYTCQGFDALPALAALLW